MGDAGGGWVGGWAAAADAPLVFPQTPCHPLSLGLIQPVVATIQHSSRARRQTQESCYVLTHSGKSFSISETTEMSCAQQVCTMSSQDHCGCG